MVIITKGLPDKLKISATELFLEALSEKFIPILGRKGKAKELIELSIEPDNCFYAIDNAGNSFGTESNVDVTGVALQKFIFEIGVIIKIIKPCFVLIKIGN